MIGLVIEEPATKNVKAIYFGPYDDRLSARQALGEITDSDLVRAQGKVVHQTIFNISTPYADVR